MSKNRAAVSAAVIFFIFYLVSAEVAEGSENEQIAYLVSGYSVWTGMPGIGMNSIKGYRGVYSVPPAPKAGSSGQQITAVGKGERLNVSVYFTREVIPVFSDFETLRAGDNTLYRAAAGKVFIYRHIDKWSFFIEFPDADAADTGFMGELVRQMVFFTRDGQNFEKSSFPAVIRYYWQAIP